MTKSTIKILMLIFNPEEAGIALKLPYANTHLEQAKEPYPDKADPIEEILDNMAEKGGVWTDNKPGVSKRYRLLPSIFGWAETPF